MRPQLIRGSGRGATRRAVATIAAVVTTVVVACGGETPTSSSTTPPPAPTFGVQLASGTLSVVRGQSTSVAVTVSRGGGYTGAIALAVTDAPNGVTAALEPTVVPAGASSSTLTLATAASMAPGTYPLTVTGSGPGVGTHTASLALTVTTTASIGVSFAVPALGLVQGETGTVAVFVSREIGYGGAIALAVSGAPAGASATLDPPVVAPGAFGSILTVAAGPTTATGTYAITVTGSGPGATSQSASLALIVASPPPPSISVWFMPADEFAWTVQGDSWTWGGIVVTRSPGYTGSVHLTLEGLPPGVTASLDPDMLGPGATTSTVTFTAARDAPLGDTRVTLRARSAGVPDATTVFRLVVFPPAGR